jgi:hypothetical protein
VLVDLDARDARLSVFNERSSKARDAGSTYGIRIAYEALSWGRHVAEYTQAWEIVAEADRLHAAAPGHRRRARPALGEMAHRPGLAPQLPLRDASTLRG